jgi:hypothetical protein
MIHIAIQGTLRDKDVKWLEKVKTILGLTRDDGPCGLACRSAAAHRTAYRWRNNTRSTPNLKGGAMIDTPARRKSPYTDFAPARGDYTDTVLFGDVWKRSRLSLRDRSASAEWSRWNVSWTRPTIFT